MAVSQDASRTIVEFDLSLGGSIYKGLTDLGKSAAAGRVPSSIL